MSNENGVDREKSVSSGDDQPREVSRRSFLIYVLGLSGALGAAGLAAPIVRYAFPSVLPSATSRVLVASKSELTPLGKVVDFEYQDVPSTLLELSDDSYVGLSRVCTHPGCVIKWQPDDDQFICPCHAGVFSPTGRVLAGPPPSPLPELELTMEGDDIWAEGWKAA